MSNSKPFSFHNLNSYDHLFKIVMIGAPQVEKKSIMYKLSNGKKYSSLTDLVSNFQVRTFRIDGKEIKLQIFAINQETAVRFDCDRFAGATAIIMVFDVTYWKSFEYVQNQIQQIKGDIKHEFDNTIMLIGNKVDQHDRQRVVSFDVASEFARTNGLFYTETSAVGDDPYAVDAPFFELATAILKKIEEEESPEFQQKKQEQQLEQQLEQQSLAENKRRLKSLFQKVLMICSVLFCMWYCYHTPSALLLLLAVFIFFISSN